MAVILITQIAIKWLMVSIVYDMDKMDKDDSCQGTTEQVIRFYDSIQNGTRFKTYDA